MALGVWDQLERVEGRPAEFLNPLHIRKLAKGKMLAEGPQETTHTTERVAAIFTLLLQDRVGGMYLGTTLS